MSLSNNPKIISWKCIAGILIIAFLYTGCRNKDLIRPGDSIVVAYKKALRLYNKKKYSDAAEAFSTVVSVGRGTDYAKSGQFFLAESYFNDHTYLVAANAYNQFISLYPQSPKRQLAQYKEGLSYFKLSPLYKLDQTYTHKAIEKFNLFLSRYPNAKQADEVASYITAMRTKLAKKKYYAAELYMRTDQYKAATIYYNLTIDQYPETSWAEHALVNEIKAYNEYASKSVPSKVRERYQKAVDSYEKYLQLFPNGKHREQAESYVDDARVALSKLGPVADNKQSSSDGQ